MQTDAPHRVFAIPELVALIAKYLSPRDIARWMMTRKTFVRQLEPILWSHLVSVPAPYTLARHRQHIQSIQGQEYCVRRLLKVMVEAIRLSPTSVDGHDVSASRIDFPRVESLDLSMRDRLFNSRVATPSIQSLVQVLSHCPNLTQLTIPGKILEQGPRVLQDFLFAMATRLPCLQRLVVKAKWLSDETGFQLTEVCLRLSQLIDLQLDFKMESYPSPLGTQNNDFHPSFYKLLEYLDTNKPKSSNDEPTGGFQLRSLILPDVEEGYPRDFLFPLFKSMISNIERLVFPGVHGDMDKADVDEIEEIIATSCPKLQHLSTLSYRNTGGSHRLINSVLRGCAKTGLRSFHVRDFSDAWDPIFGTLIQHHGRTLEKVELPNCSHVNSVDIQSILTTCNNLRMLRMDPSEDHNVSIPFYQVVSSEWVCCDLTVLELCLNRKVPVLKGKSRGEVIMDAAQRMYSQIGRLVNLEELNLHYDMDDCSSEEGTLMDLTLKDGWLSELAGLKNIKYFYMDWYTWSSMGQLEVEFMDIYWPKLKGITFAGEEVLEEVLDMAHWCWLKRKRPHLAYWMRLEPWITDLDDPVSDGSY
ncbi:hypothetical protein B0O80DRAFT_499805 [Mortierella sp. GBAus27b]|nr:hypothetical protein B0O80DRAFT_499805 [Mortierella sp. GBAus27b]